MNHGLSLFIYIKYSLSEQKELEYRKQFNAGLNCLVLLDKFLIHIHTVHRSNIYQQTAEYETSLYQYQATHTHTQQTTDTTQYTLHKNKQYNIIIQILFLDMLLNLVEFDEGWSFVRYLCFDSLSLICIVLHY